MNVEGQVKCQRDDQLSATPTGKNEGETRPGIDHALQEELSYAVRQATSEKSKVSQKRTYSEMLDELLNHPADALRKK